MTAATVLARIDVDGWFRRPREHRDAVCAWLRANGIDPADVTLDHDIAVVLLDAPAIVYAHAVRDPSRRWDVRTVHALLRVELPAHLADPL